ncbi:unnamed protein product [Paramecium octaurelia]|uniref:Uncharacterized protein n=1 Tax=Paramecium octaurelia TaxID=43137 RepID=A0A8S1W430_PAROT|nr:unnamed protein product [Paramecium octaurelia]
MQNIAQQSDQEKEANQQLQKKRQTWIQQKKPQPSDSLSKQHKYQQKHKAIAKQNLKPLKKEKEILENQNQMMQRTQKELVKLNQQLKYQESDQHQELFYQSPIMFESTKMCTGMNGVDFNSWLQQI